MLYKNIVSLILGSALCAITVNVKSQHIVSTYAGTGAAGLKNGILDSAKFNSPVGICRDKSGNFYITESGNNCIRKISTAGVVSTYAGTGAAGYLDGSLSGAKFNSPFDICIDDSGNIYISDFNNQRIREIRINGTVITIAGNGTAGYLDASGTSAEFNYPRGLCIDKNRNLYVADSWNHRIRKIDPSGNVTTYAGGGSAMGVGSTGALVDANDTSARFYTPSGLSIDKKGNIYVADAYNHRIRKIDTGRAVTTFCGSGPTGPGNGGYADGNSTSAILNTPTEVHWDTLGNILIGDTYNSLVRKADSMGTVSTIAGDGTAGFVNGNSTAAEFNHDRGIICNKTEDSIYVVDGNNNVVRLIVPGSLGIDEKNAANYEVNVYPNPFNDNATVALDGNIHLTDATLRVYNVFGQTVETINNVNSNKITIEKGNMPNGIYIYHLFNEGAIIGKGRFVIE
jgi:hypothetical protein